MKQRPGKKLKSVKLIIGHPVNLEVKGDLEERGHEIVLRLNDWKILVLALAISVIPYAALHFTVKLALHLFG